MTNNKTLAKQLTADTESIFGRIKNKIDPRTKSAIITKLGITFIYFVYLFVSLNLHL